MPLITPTHYPGPPAWMRNGHLETILPALQMPKVHPPFQRERICTPDDDFLDLDWHRQGSDRLVILTHGLEGNIRRPYMLRMAQSFAMEQWDVLAWNCRSCSGEMNRQLRLYHHGEISDLAFVIAQALQKHTYKRIFLIGFSMGGSMTLKYLGTQGNAADQAITGGMAISTPCDLKGSIQALERWDNGFYRRKFLKSLFQKMQQKAQLHPGSIDLSKWKSIREWRDFDLHYTAPLNGFESPEHFYREASALHFMAGAQRPVLVLNALNDPMLPESCSPSDLCRDHPFLYLECPPAGGHVGFQIKNSPQSWMEQRALEFVRIL